MDESEGAVELFRKMDAVDVGKMVVAGMLGVTVAVARKETAAAAVVVVAVVSEIVADERKGQGPNCTAVEAFAVELVAVAVVVATGHVGMNRTTFHGVPFGQLCTCPV